MTCHTGYQCITLHITVGAGRCHKPASSHLSTVLA